MKLSIKPMLVEKWFGGNIEPVLDLIKLADEKGIDAVTLSEHVIISKRDLDDYPYAPDAKAREASFDEESDFLEPIVLLATIGRMTQRIRLSTGVLLAGLRPAALLAKQVATLDVLTRGRVELAVGVGWQKMEYEALNIPWERRFGRLMETIEICKLLWSTAPVSFAGDHYSFEDVYCMPLPVQPGGPPIFFGIAPSERNIERMARWGDGWSPIGLPLSVVIEAFARIRRRLEELGRNPDAFSLKLSPPLITQGGAVDLDATLAGIPALAKLGCTHVEMYVHQACANADEFENFLDRYLAYRSV